MTKGVLKLDISNDFNKLQPENINPISTTKEVLKLDKFNNSNELHC